MFTIIRRLLKKNKRGGDAKRLGLVSLRVSLCNIWDRSARDDQNWKSVGFLHDHVYGKKNPISLKEKKKGKEIKLGRIAGPFGYKIMRDFFPS